MNSEWYTVTENGEAERLWGDWDAKTWLEEYGIRDEVVPPNTNLRYISSEYSTLTQDLVVIEDCRKHTDVGLRGALFILNTTSGQKYLAIYK